MRKSREQLLSEIEQLQLTIHQLQDEYQQTILKENRKLNNILESIRDGFMSLDYSWNFLYVNKEAEKIFMKKRDELIGKNVWELFPLAVGKNIYNELHKAKEEKITVHFEHVGLRTGKIYDTVVYPSEFGLSVYFLDITERKQAAITKIQLASIVESSKDCIISANPEGKIISFNHGAEQILYWSADEVINQSIFTLFEKSTHQRIQEKIQLALEGADLDYFRTQLIRKNGEKVEVNISIFPTKNLKGTVGISMIARDITDVIRMKEEIIKLDRLNIIGQMAAGVGHEIRNPMTSIRGFLQLMSQKDQYQNDRPFFHLMLQELDRVNSIITELLSLGKSKAMNVKEINLEGILKTIKPLLDADAMRLGMNLVLECGNVPRVNFNEEEIRQLVYNLVINGIEAMEPGGTIFIRTSIENNQIVLSIKDEGVGIDKEILDKIGTPFFTTKEKGTGLGLAICNAIVTRNNARMDIQTSSKGTTFQIKFGK